MTTRSKDPDGTNEDSPLYSAVAAGDVHAVKTLLESGVDINATTPRGLTALFPAVRKGVGMVNMLLDRGAKVDGADKSPRTPLLDAIELNDNTVIEVLLKRGANPNARGSAGRTALHCAARNGDVESVERLLNAGAAVNARDAYGGTPLHEASERRWGADPVVTALLQGGAEVNARDKAGLSPEQRARRAGNMRVAETLHAWASRRENRER